MIFDDELDTSLFSSEEISECKMKFEKKFVCSFCKLELENEEELFSHCNTHGSNSPTSNSYAFNGNHIDMVTGDCNSQVLNLMELDRLVENGIETCTKMRLTTGDAAMHTDDGSVLPPIAEIQQISSPKQYSSNIIYIKSSSKRKLKKVCKNMPFRKCSIYTCPICKIIFCSIDDCDDHFAIEHGKKIHQRQRLIEVVLQRSYKKILTEIELKIIKNKSKILRRKFLKNTEAYCPKGIRKIRKINSQKEHRNKKQFEPHCEELDKSPSQEEYIVEEILDKRICDGQVEYYVKWLGYSIEECTWEPVGNFHSLEVIKEYEASISKKERDVLVSIAKFDDCNSNILKNESFQSHLNEAEIVNVSEEKKMSSKADRPCALEQTNHLNEAEVPNVSEGENVSSKDDRPYTPEQTKKHQSFELIFIGDSTAKYVLPRNFESSVIKTSVICEEGASMERIAVLVDNCLSDLERIEANHKIFLIIFVGSVELSNQSNKFSDTDIFFRHIGFIFNKAQNSNLPHLVVIFTFPNPIDYKRYDLYTKHPMAEEKLPLMYDLIIESDRELLWKSKQLAFKIQKLENICKDFWPSKDCWHYLHIGKLNSSTITSFKSLLEVNISSSVSFKFLGQDFFVNGFHLSHLGAIRFWAALCKLLLKYVDFSFEELLAMAPYSENSSLQSPYLILSCKEKLEAQVPLKNTIDLATFEFGRKNPSCNFQNVMRNTPFIKRSSMKSPVTLSNGNPSEHCVSIENTPSDQKLKLTKSDCKNVKISAPLQTATDNATPEFESECPNVNVHNVVKSADLNTCSDKEGFLTFKDNDLLKKAKETTQQLHNHCTITQKPSQAGSSVDILKTGFKNKNSNLIDYVITQNKNKINRTQVISTFNTSSDVIERVFNQSFERVKPIFRKIFMEELKKEGLWH